MFAQIMGIFLSVFYKTNNIIEERGIVPNCNIYKRVYYYNNRALGFYYDLVNQFFQSITQNTLQDISIILVLILFTIVAFDLVCFLTEKKQINPPSALEEWVVTTKS
jgi:hypothetical protein